MKNLLRKYQNTMYVLYILWCFVSIPVLQALFRVEIWTLSYFYLFVGTLIFNWMVWTTFATFIDSKD